MIPCLPLLLVLFVADSSSSVLCEPESLNLGALERGKVTSFTFSVRNAAATRFELIVASDSDWIIVNAGDRGISLAPGELKEVRAYAHPFRRVQDLHANIHVGGEGQSSSISVTGKLSLDPVHDAVLLQGTTPPSLSFSPPVPKIHSTPFSRPRMVTVQATNTSDDPIRVIGIRTTCEIGVLSDPDVVLAPRESRDFEFDLRPVRYCGPNKTEITFDTEEPRRRSYVVPVFYLVEPAGLRVVPLSIRDDEPLLSGDPLGTFSLSCSGREALDLEATSDRGYCELRWETSSHLAGNLRLSVLAADHLLPGRYVDRILVTGAPSGPFYLPVEFLVGSAVNAEPDCFRLGVIPQGQAVSASITVRSLVDEIQVSDLRATVTGHSPRPRVQLDSTGGAGALVQLSLPPLSRTGVHQGVVALKDSTGRPVLQLPWKALIIE